MFALPQLVWFPDLMGVVTGTVEWSLIETFFAWTLLAALVGTSLALLRDYIKETSRRRYARPAEARREPAGFVADEIHREAA